ncbi:hypothetical protein [Wolbachia endosymbiont of Protocalliphora sialia]
MTISVANGVSYLHDRKIGYLNDKRELLVRHVIPALDAGIQIKTSLE